MAAATAKHRAAPRRPPSAFRIMLILHSFRFRALAMAQAAFPREAASLSC